MIWKRPVRLWEWLLLLAPAVAAMLSASIAKSLMPPIAPLQLSHGYMIPNVMGHVARMTWIALGVLALLSCVMAFLYSRGKSIFDRLSNAFVIAVCLFLVNAFISIGGCALLGVPNPARNAFPPSERLP